MTTEPEKGDVWEAIQRLTHWLDRNNGDRSPEMTMSLRLHKLGEEAGEVSLAFIGMHGQNPRKGHSHNGNDLSTELCDVAVTALVALCTHVGIDIAKLQFDERLSTLLDRTEKPQ